MWHNAENKGRPPPLSLLAFTKERAESAPNFNGAMGRAKLERETMTMIEKLRKHDQRLVAVVTTASPGRATPHTDDTGAEGRKEAKENIRTGPFDDDERAGAADTPARQTDTNCEDINNLGVFSKMENLRSRHGRSPIPRPCSVIGNDSWATRERRISSRDERRCPPRQIRLIPSRLFLPHLPFRSIRLLTPPYDRANTNKAF